MCLLFSIHDIISVAIILMAMQLQPFQVKAKRSTTEHSCKYQRSHLSADRKTRFIVILSTHAYSKLSSVI